MKRNAIFIIVILTLLFFTKAYGQEKFNFDLGRVTQLEMDMVSYDKDPEAEALFIFNKGNYYFIYNYDRGFEVYMNYKIKIKILKQAGAEYADFEIPFYDGPRSWEEVFDVSGITYNYENGILRKTALAEGSIFEKKYRDDFKSKMFTMPDVKEGSIIELTYTIRSPYLDRMREWKFQQKVPVITSELTYKATPFFTYSYILTGAKKFDHFKSEVLNNTLRYGSTEYKEVAFTFGMDNLLAFRDEEFITSSNDYMVRLNMQLAEIQYPSGGKDTYMTTWPEICSELLKSPYFGKYISASEKEAKKVIPTLGIEGKSDIEKIKIISDHVKMMYNWNQYFGKYADVDKLSDFLKRKSGNGANLNLYLIGLLRAANLDADPVIISTRENGAVSKDHPFASFFNYVLAVVKVDGKEHFIDATESLLTYNELPSRCINVSGLIVRPKNAESWTFIAQNEPASTTKEFNIKVDPGKGIQGIDTKYIAYGNDAFNYRKQYLFEKEDLAPFFKKRYNIDTENGIKVENYMERDKEFVMSFQFKQPLEGSSDKLFIKPFCSMSISDNIFKKNTRTLPIDLVFIGGDNYKSQIEVPDGYTVEYLPKSVHTKSQVMTVDYEARIESDKIIIEAGYQMTRNIYPASEYNRLKSIMAAAIEKFSDMIVLVKK